MAETRFTPGPWIIHPMPPRDVRLKRPHWAFGVRGGKGLGLAFGATDADACLVMTAPELYGELENARAIIAGELPHYIAAVDRIDALLAKARGETAHSEDQENDIPEA